MLRSKRIALGICTLAVCGVALAQEKPAPPSRWGKHPMSLLRRCRTAKTVGKGHVSIAAKIEYVDCDEIWREDGYQDIVSPHKFEHTKLVPVAKIGYAKNAHVAIGVPYIRTDLTSGKKDISDEHLGNIFVFHKWNCMPETANRPGIALDVWYYFDTGEPDCKAGTDSDAVKLTAEFSKTWKWADVHLNPGYRFAAGEGNDVLEINAGTYLRLSKALRPCLEYNYLDKDNKGDAHDLVPGFLWIIKPGRATIKAGAIINLDSSMTYRDDLGGVVKFFARF